MMLMLCIKSAAGMEMALDQLALSSEMLEYMLNLVLINCCTVQAQALQPHPPYELSDRFLSKKRVASNSKL